MEGHDHGEQAEIIENNGKLAADTGNIPCAHGGEEQDQRNGDNGDQNAVGHGLQEGIVTDGHTIDIVRQAGKGLRIGQSEGISGNGSIGLEGVGQNFKNWYTYMID